MAIPRLPEHLLLYPELCVGFISSAQTINISKREADIAIRMFRPKEGTLFAKRLGKLRFSFYASDSYLKRRGIPDEKFMKDHFLLDYPDTEGLDGDGWRMRAQALRELKCYRKSRI